MALGRDQILKADDLPTREVHVPEWADGSDDVVIVRGLSGEERDAFEASLTTMRPGPERGRLEPVQDLANMRAKLVASSIVDEDGKRIFSASDVFALGQKSALALTRVFEVASELSGLGVNAVDEALENSEAVPSDGSISS